MTRISKEEYGKPIEYNPDFKGPLKKRSCTDVIFLFIFISFIACWIFIGCYAIKHGNPKILLVPKDSQGQRCNLDPGVRGKPYLFFFDITKCLSPSAPFLGCNTPQVCVEKCPDDNFFHTEIITKTSLNKDVVLKYCTNKVVKYDSTKCPTWFLKSNPVAHRCIPLLKIVNNTEVKSILDKFFPHGNFEKKIILISKTNKIVEQVIADIINAKWTILIGTVLALLCCIIFILMLRWIAWTMVWTSIVGVIILLAGGSYVFYTQWRTWRILHLANLECGDCALKMKIYLSLLIIFASVFGVVLILVIFLTARILLANELIKEGSKAIGSVTSALFFPIVPWLLQLGVIAYAVCVGVYLATTGNPLYQIRNITDTCKGESNWTEKTPCNPDNFTRSFKCKEATCKFIKITNQDYYLYMQGTNIFGFFWLSFFVSALGQMVLAQIFAQWYWTFKKSSLPFLATSAAFERTIRYHMGTLAFGSLIIAICRIIRICLEYVSRKLKQYDNQLVKVIIKCLKCFFWCLEKFIKFINKNAYIMCAIHGKPFCASAKNAVMLLMRNIVRVFVLDKITDFVFFLSKLLITLGAGAVAYTVFITDHVHFTDNLQLHYEIVPVLIITVVTYLIASLFFNVYSMAVDTLFLCFLEDCERNDGTESKPYYMSKNLMKILGKGNKSLKEA